MSMPFKYNPDNYDFEARKARKFRHIAMSIGASICGISASIYQTAEMLSDEKARAGTILMISALATAIVAFDEVQSWHTTQPEVLEELGATHYSDEDIEGAAEIMINEVEDFLRRQST